MSISRSKGIVPVAALALLAVIGAVVAALTLRIGAPAAPPLATRQLEAAASQRPVNKTDQLIWSYQEHVRQTLDEQIGTPALKA